MSFFCGSLVEQLSTLVINPQKVKKLNRKRLQSEANPKTSYPNVPPGFAPGISREENLMAVQYISHYGPTERQARILWVQQYLDERSSDSSTCLPKVTLNHGNGK